MDEDAFNMSIRKFLKKVGITAQRDIETAVRDALQSGKLRDGESLPAKVVLTVEGADLSVTIDGEIALE